MTEQLTDLNKVLIDFLYSNLEKVFEGHTYKKDPRKGDFRMSGIASICDRKIIFENILGWKAPDYLMLTSIGGTLVHAVIQAILKEVNDDFRNNIETVAKLNFEIVNFTGHTDILVINLSGYVFVIDIKTMKKLYIDYNTGLPKVEWIVKDYHINQVMMYIASYLKANPHIKQENVMGALWYIERTNDNPELFAILDRNKSYLTTFEYDRSIVQDMVSRAVRITTMLSNDLLPTPIELTDNTKSWICVSEKMTCQYYNLCHRKESKIETLTELLLQKETEQS